ncbi:hypothetical protein DPMN_163067, partial [Dreissena polymorpha]
MHTFLPPDAYQADIASTGSFKLGGRKEGAYMQEMHGVWFTHSHVVPCSWQGSAEFTDWRHNIYPGPQPCTLSVCLSVLISDDQW